MKRALALSSILILLGAAGVFAGEAADGGLRALDDANRALAGRRATVELKSGELFSGVRQVSLGPDTTTWEAAGEAREIATADVQRITVSKRARMRRWARSGLLVGGLVGAVSGGYSEKDGFFIESPSAAGIAGGAAAGAAIGAAAGAMAGEKVVFEAPGALGQR